MSGLGGTQWTLRAGEHRATVVEVGAGLLSYRVGEDEVTCTYPTDGLPPKCCGVTLVPWPNRIRDGRYTFAGTEQQLALTEPDKSTAIHGLGRWARWERVRGGDSELTLRLDVVPQKGYPWPVRCETTYRLDATSGLTVTLTARNRGTAPAPFGAGQHPFVSTRGHRLDDVTLRLPARTRLDLDGQAIPVGSHRVTATEDFRRGRRLRDARFDDCFTGLTVADGRGAAEVRFPGGGARLWFDETFRYLQVFTLDALTPDRPGIAIEPMTCPPDAFNSGDGVIVLDPGATWSGSWGIAPL